MEYANEWMRLNKDRGQADLYRLISEFNKGLKITSIAPGNFIQAGILNNFHSSHRFMGHAEVIDGIPVLYVAQLDGKSRPDPGKFFLLPWSWMQDYGSAFTLTLNMPHHNPTKRKMVTAGRCFLPKGNEVLKQLGESSSFVIVLLEKRRISGVYRVAYTSDNANEKIRALVRDTEEHTSQVMNFPEAIFWATVDTLASSFTRRDRLMKAWEFAFKHVGHNYEVQSFSPARATIKDDRANLESSFHNAPPEWQAYLNFLLDTGVDLARTCKYLDGLRNQPGMLFKLRCHSIVYTQLMEKCAVSRGHVDFAVSALKLILMFQISPSVTAFGTRVASLNMFTKELCYMDIAIDEFPDDAVDTFWESYQHMLTDVSCNLTLIAKGNDVPAHYATLANELKKIAVTGTDAALRDCANTLLGEARACQKWTIPWGATVEINFGPFRYAQFYDLPGDVHVVLRTSDWRYIVVLFAQGLDGGNTVTVLNEDGEPNENLSAAMFMILAAIIRDFFVVEERHKVFKSERMLSLSHKQANKDVSIVYIPRVKYTYDVDAERVASNLDYKERRAHFVAAHQRLAKTTSEKQRNLAALYNFNLKEGYTFVKPHERGHKKKETIYRSRSALQSIYEAEIYQEGGSIPDWFKFEKDVASLLERMKYTVEHVARNRNGDEGIDVYAQKGDTNWIVQCKCYGKQKVGPREVRELVGAIALLKEKAEGLLVTTGEITEGARVLAREVGIRTIDGQEFLSLLEAP